MTALGCMFGHMWEIDADGEEFCTDCGVYADDTEGEFG
jgi:hypothetical protein